MLNKDQFFNFLKINNNMEFSKEEIINRFAESKNEEQSIDSLLSELEVESTYTNSNLIASCKAGTVYYKWKNLNITNWFLILSSSIFVDFNILKFTVDEFQHFRRRIKVNNFIRFAISTLRIISSRIQ